MAVLQIHRLPGVKENPTQSPAGQRECWALRIAEGSLTRGKYPDLRAAVEGPSLCPRSLFHTASQPIRVMSCHTHTSCLHSFLASSIRYVCTDKPDWLPISCFLVSVPSPASLPSNLFLCPSLRHQSPHLLENEMLWMGMWKFILLSPYVPS